MGDPVFDFLDSGGKTGAPAPQPAAPQAKSTNDPVYDFLNSGGKGFVSAGPKTLAPAVASAQPSPLGVRTPSEDDAGPLPGVAGHILSGMGGAIVGGWHGLAKLATGGTWDDAANAVREDTERLTYQPKEGSSAAKALDVLDAPLTALSRGAKWAGEKAQDAGASPGVATAIETGINAAPLLFGLKGGIAAESRVIPFPRVEPTLRGEAPIVKAAPLAEPGIGTPLPSVGGRAEPVLSPQAEVEATQAKVKTATDWAKAQKDLYEALDKAEPKAVIDDLQAKASAAEQAHKQLELVPAESKTVTPSGTTEPAPANPAQFIGPEDTSATAFSEAAEPVPAGMSDADLANGSRAQILKRVGIGEARRSALTGDLKASNTDFDISKGTDEPGYRMKAVMESERQALESHAAKLIQDTGGTAGTDSTALYERGNTVIEPLDNLNKWFNKRISALYKEADTRAGGMPVELPKTQEFVGGDQAEFLGTTEGESLLKGIQARMRSLGMVDKEGNTQPVTVKQAEQFKQYLNNQWGPRTSRLISGLKNAIDDDVLQNAGADIYAQARAMRKMKADVFENDVADAQGRTIPNGIAKIVDANGRNVELLKDTEKVPDMVASMPVDQFRHIVKTLKDIATTPEMKELQPQAEAALSEIKAQFANKIHDAGASRVGQWGARDVSKYLNKNAAKLQQVFSPEELAKFDDLNEAGHILAKDQSYAGAEVQKQNLIRSGATKMLTAGGAVAGEALMGGMGAGAGAVAGAAAARALGKKLDLKAVNKRIVKLSDFPGVSD